MLMVPPPEGAAPQALFGTRRLGGEQLSHPDCSGARWAYRGNGNGMESKGIFPDFEGKLSSQVVKDSVSMTYKY